MSYSLATFSAVTPMWMAWNGSCSAPSIMSTSLASPMRAPQRAIGARYGARLMLSAPPPMATSASPSRMVWAALMMACRPEPQRRFTVSAGALIDTPPFTAATRPEVHVLGFGLDHIAEHHVADVVAGHIGAGQRLAHDQRAQIGRGQVLQAAAEGRRLRCAHR